MRTMGIGLAIGLVGAWMLAHFVQAFLFEGNAHDPLVYVGAGVLVVVAGLIAALVPAKRAAEVDPLVALRTQ